LIAYGLYPAIKCNSSATLSGGRALYPLYPLAVSERIAEITAPFQIAEALDQPRSLSTILSTRGKFSALFERT